jgi:hypothetical protein
VDVTVNLERFPTRVCELMIEDNTGEDFAGLLARELTTRCDAEFEFRIQQRRASATDLFRRSCLEPPFDQRSPASRVT